MLGSLRVLLPTLVTSSTRMSNGVVKDIEELRTTRNNSVILAGI